MRPPHPGADGPALSSAKARPAPAFARAPPVRYARRAMMNAVWLVLIVASIVAAAFMGTTEAVSTASIDDAKSAVTLALGLIGVMAFWLGLMRVVQEGGLLHALARALRPVMSRLFPEVPPDHPAMSAMIMNIAANMMGLGN